MIPAFDESATIAAVVSGVRRYVDTVVVVDDGSRDGTAELAEAAGAVCLRHPRNEGKGTALRFGIVYASAGEFTHVLFLDGDGQHRVEDIPALIAAARTGADLVIGNRRFDRAAMPAARYYSNRLGSRIASWLAGSEIPDSQSGFRLIRMERLRQVRLRSSKYEIEMEILIKMSRLGCRIAHAPVAAVYENGRTRSKMKPVSDTVRICFHSLWFRWARLVLFLALSPALLCAQNSNDALLARIWNGVQETQKKIVTGHGTITETRTSKLLARPLVFHGRFYASGTNKFLLEYKEPDPVRIVFNQDYLNVTTGKRTEVLRIGEHVKRTQAYFSRENSIDNLKQNFTITVKEDRSGYEMRLVPRSARFKRRLNYVVVRLNRGDFLLRGLEVDGASGVNSRFEIRLEAVNSPSDENVFKVYRP